MPILKTNTCLKYRAISGPAPYHLDFMHYFFSRGPDLRSFV
jgi:hypothetical protein